MMMRATERNLAAKPVIIVGQFALGGHNDVHVAVEYARDATTRRIETRMSAQKEHSAASLSRVT